MSYTDTTCYSGTARVYHVALHKAIRIVFYKRMLSYRKMKLNLNLTERWILNALQSVIIHSLTTQT